MRVKKFISSLLVVVMLLSMLPTSVFAIPDYGIRISDESVNVDVQDDCAYFQYPDADSEYVYMIIPMDSLGAYGVSDADELVSIINDKCGSISADLSDDKYDFDAGLNDADVVNGSLNFELYVATGDASVFKESNDMPIYTSGVLVFYRLDSNYVTADATAYGFPSECPTAYIYSITGLYAEKVEVDDLGGFTFGLDIDDSGLTNATVEADVYSGFEMGDSVSLAIIPNDGFEFITEPTVEVYGGDVSSLTASGSSYTFTIFDIYDEVSVIVEGEAVSTNDDDVDEPIDSVYDISLDTTLLLNATAELSKSSNVVEDDVVILTITPYTSYDFDVMPVVSVIGATAGSVVDNTGYYTCEITDFIQDAEVTVSGEAKDSSLANGPVAIDYIDPSITDVVWDGSTNITINSEADIYILEAYNHEATMTISADVDIIGYDYLTTVTTNKSAFVINNGANVTIEDVRIDRSVTNTNGYEDLIRIDGASLEANNIDIYETCRGVFALTNDASLVIGGDATEIENRTNKDKGMPIFNNIQGDVVVNDGYYVRGVLNSSDSNSGQIVKNGTDSSFTMNGGTIYNDNGTLDTVIDGTITINGGSISSPNSGAIRTSNSTDVITITGGTISDSAIGIRLAGSSVGSSVTIGGDVEFENNDKDIYLINENSMFTVEEDFMGTASVSTAVDLSTVALVQITSNGTAEDLKYQIYPADSDVAINYDSTDGYLYLWEHTHSWVYSSGVSETDKIFASCEDTNCTYSDGALFIQIIAEDGIACDADYDGVSIVDNTANIIPEYTVEYCYYLVTNEGRIQGLTSKPTAMGNYMVTIELDDAVATAEFSIDHIWASDCDEICEDCPYDRGFNAIHNFSDEICSSDTLISEADCENGSIYYLTCADCGKISDSETFEDTDSLGHKFTSRVKKNSSLVEAANCQHGSIYYYSCVTCGTKSNSDAYTFEDNDILDCDFTEEVIGDEYLKSAADCENDAVYYLSCNMCGGSSNDDSLIFVDVDSQLGHDHSVPQYDENNHWYKCVRCDSIDSVEGHFGGTATCQDKAICEHLDCNQPYGDVIPCEFTKLEVRADYFKESATCQHGDIYYKSCVMCDASSNDDTLTFAHTAPVPCQFTNEVQSDDYLISAVTCQDVAVYTKVCIWCETGSTDENDYYEFGTVIPCEFTEEIAHPDYLMEEATCGGPAKFFRSCHMCGASDTDRTNYFEDGLPLEHTYATVYTVGDDTHYYAAICEHTNEKYMEEPHSYIEEVISAEYLVSEADCVAPTTYYKSCICGKAGTETFTDGEVTDHTYDETVWVTDDTHHWYASTCVHTDAKKDYAEHTASEWIIDEAAKIGVKGSKHKECTICAMVLETAEIPAKSSNSGVSYYSIEKESTKNGSFTVSRNSTYSGANVVITVKPDKGYEVASVVVEDTKGNEIEVTKKSDGTYSFKMPSRNVSVSVKFKSIPVVSEKNDYLDCKNDYTCPMHNYRDIDTNAWYHDGAHYCLDNGIMVGYGEGEFKPNVATSRAMVAVMLWRLEGTPLVPGGERFNDVYDGDWYYNAIRWASANNIAGGYGENIWAPNDNITREQLVSILYRYAQYKGIDVSVGEETNILSYDDVFDVSEWAIPAMQWACGADIVVGDGNKLMPTDSATRAQMASIFQRFCVNILKIESK